jgi:pimeloyl-ACP methyl ester carboxylesterase
MARIAPRLWVSVVGLVLASLIGAPARSEDAFFDSAGVKIHYQVEGKGEPVLLIHGFTANINLQWGVPGIIKSLSSDYQVIALDNRGHGRSGKPHDPQKYGMEMVSDAVRLMDHLKLQKVHVVGYSMGAFITGKLLVEHPDRLISATLGGAGWPKPDDHRLKFLDDLGDSLDAGKGIGPLLEHLTPAGRPKPSATQVSFANQMLMLTNDPKALAAAIRGMRGLAVTEEQLRANKVPTLALIGEIDPLKEGVDALEPLMPNLTVRVIDGADHMNAFARPEFVVGLKQFLAKNASLASAAGK